MKRGNKRALLFYAVSMQNNTGVLFCASDKLENLALRW
jgi:hypothetical protein